MNNSGKERPPKPTLVNFDLGQKFPDLLKGSLRDIKNFINRLHFLSDPQKADLIVKIKAMRGSRNIDDKSDNGEDS